MRKMQDFVESKLGEDFGSHDYYDTVLLSEAVPLKISEARVSVYVKKNRDTSK